jgi:phosphatidyl-myo-inositol dimannoside synthase
MKRAIAPRLVFAMTASSEAGGGIAAVNRLMIPALSDFAAERNIDLAVLSMQGTERDRPPELRERDVYRAFDDRRGQFIAALWRAWAASRPVFVFERVGLALPLLPLAFPGLARTVIFAHGSENWRVVRWTDRWSILRSQLVITNSHFTLRRMHGRFPSLRGQACPLGLSSSHALRSAAASDAQAPLELEACDGQVRPLGDRVLLLVGRIDPRERRKGHDLLIDVLPQLLRRHPGVQLVLAGPGADRPHLARLARESGVAGAVFAPGFVETAVLDRLYAHCYAFVMPSRQEGFGLVYLEAMNHAKPCVGCFGDGAEDVIVDQDTGYLLRDPRSGRELLTVLNRLFDDPEHAAALGRHGFDRLQTYFTPERFHRRLKRILAEAFDTVPRHVPHAANSGERG